MSGLFPLSNLVSTWLSRTLRKLCLQGFNIPDQFSPLNFPSLASLEIKADKLSHLSTMEYILVPQLRDFRVHVESDPGWLHKLWLIY